MSPGPLADRIEQRKQSITECLAAYGFPADTSYHDDLLNLDVFPGRPTKKLAFLILTYKRECPIEILKQVSDQPAGIVKNLRDEGFVFKSDSRRPDAFQFRNQNGQLCRQILYVSSPRVQPKGRAKELIDKSVAACVSAIEVYNKPDFAYREETFAILIVNAWELLLKAKILLDNRNSLRSILVYDRDGNPKRSRSGNLLTIEIYGAFNRLIAEGKLDERCRINIEVLLEIRDNAVHFTNNSTDFQKKVMEIGTATLQNYLSAAREWFNRDLSQYNFYLMPLSFFPPTDVRAHAIPGDSEIAKLLQYIYETEKAYPSSTESNYNVSLSYEVKLRRAADPDYTIFVSPNAPDGVPITIQEEDVFKTKYPLSFEMLVERLRERYTDFKQNKRFNELKRRLEDPAVHGERYCRIRYLNSLQQKGAKQTFYSTEILKEFDKHYTRR